MEQRFLMASCSALWSREKNVWEEWKRFQSYRWLHSTFPLQREQTPAFPSPRTSFPGSGTPGQAGRGLRSSVPAPSDAKVRPALVVSPVGPASPYFSPAFIRDCRHVLPLRHLHLNVYTVSVLHNSPPDIVYFAASGGTLSQPVFPGPVQPAQRCFCCQVRSGYSPACTRRRRISGPTVMEMTIFTMSTGINGNTQALRAAMGVLVMTKQNQTVPRA